MKTLPAMHIAMLSLLSVDAAMAQNSTMMNGGWWDGSMMGGYGGTWVPVLLVVAVAALVAWVVVRGRK